jgi:hypothetical protein
MAKATAWPILRSNGTMAKETLWESICRLAGDDGGTEVPIALAIERSAVTEQVGLVEINLFVEQGLVQRIGDDRIRLTTEGRVGCSDNNHTHEFSGL